MKCYQQIMTALLLLTLLGTFFVPVTCTATVSESIHLTSTILEPKPEIGIELNATALSFGLLYPGDTSNPQDLKVTNIGLKEIDVTATASDDSTEPLFVQGLLINNAAYSDYSATLIANESDDTQLMLHVPDDYASRGDVSGGATFWAEEHIDDLMLIADFSCDVGSGTAPLTVVFTDLSTGSPASWAWDFDSDGTVDSTEQNPTHTYSEPGTYTVTLTVNNAAGADSEIKANLVTVGVSRNDDWSQWQNSVTHYAVHQTDSPVTSAYLSWTYDAGGTTNNIDVTPLIVGDVVYIFDASGQVHAVNRSTGTAIWSASIDGSSYFQSSIPAYGDGKLFVASYNGYIYSFDATTGERLWKVKATSSTSRSFECPITYYDHKLYIGEGLAGLKTTKYYYCYDDQGQQLWNYAVENTSGFLWGGAVGVGDHLVFPVFEGRLVSVDRLTGLLSDEIDLTNSSQLSFAQPGLGMIRASVTYADDHIYVTTEKGQSTGYIFKVAYSDGQFQDEGWSTHIGFSTSTPVVYDGRVYVGNGEHGARSGNMTCLSEVDGSILWSYQVDSGVKSSPALFVDGDQVYIYFAVERGTNGSVYCVDSNGNLVWEFDPQGDDAYILQGVALSGDAVYFGTDGGKLYCLSNLGGDMG